MSNQPLLSTASAKHSYKQLRYLFSASSLDAICRRMSNKEKRSFAFASSIGPGNLFDRLTMFGMLIADTGVTSTSRDDAYWDDLWRRVLFHNFITANIFVVFYPGVLLTTKRFGNIMAEMEWRFSFFFYLKQPRLYFGAWQSKVKRFHSQDEWTFCSLFYFTLFMWGTDCLSSMEVIPKSANKRKLKRVFMIRLSFEQLTCLFYGFVHAKFLMQL